MSVELGLLLLGLSVLNLWVALRQWRTPEHCGQCGLKVTHLEKEEKQCWKCGLLWD